MNNKIDFALVISVKNANPNGDPLNGNMPRTNIDGLGEISDVCLKRKIRDRLMDKGEKIFVQSDERAIDGKKSLKERFDDFLKKKETKNSAETMKAACEEWFDVRTFGQVFAFKGSGSDGVSIPVRGPVTMQSAFSVAQVGITSTQITKSVNSEDGPKKGSDTMGMKHRVDRAIYVAYGAITPQLAERTGFSDKDAETFKSVLPRLFEGDASSARPEGSMQVLKVIWWKHNSKGGQYSSAKVHNLLKVNEDGSYKLDSLDGLKAEEIDGY